jgi:hypothetical protein
MGGPYGQVLPVPPQLPHFDENMSDTTIYEIWITFKKDLGPNGAPH